MSPWLLVGAARTAVASVWLYEGLWCKLLAADAGQRAIVASAPAIGGAAGFALAAIGVAETALAGWVLSGRARRLAAVVQTALLVVFNAGGLLFGAGRISEPGRMLTANAALLAAAWLLARGAAQEHHHA
jgi:uncharacterized membrane protein YphA (DoxX/SURF4 family)